MPLPTSTWIGSVRTDPEGGGLLPAGVEGDRHRVLAGLEEAVGALSLAGLQNVRPLGDEVTAARLDRDREIVSPGRIVVPDEDVLALYGAACTGSDHGGAVRAGW